MEKSFNLTNLRELSTEEQLRLNGGSDSTGCTCSPCKCECEGETPKSTVEGTARAVPDAVKKRLEK